MRRPIRVPARRGAMTVEAAVAVPVFLAAVLGVIDLGVGVARYNTLSQAARYGARQAAVHGASSAIAGSSAPAWSSAWGTATVDQAANATGVPEVTAVQPMLVNCPLAQTRVR